MKEILLDLAAMSKEPEVENQLLDFGVVGPGPRRALNFLMNRLGAGQTYPRRDVASGGFSKKQKTRMIYCKQTYLHLGSRQHITMEGEALMTLPGVTPVLGTFLRL